LALKSSLTHTSSVWIQVDTQGVLVTLCFTLFFLLAFAPHIIEQKDLLLVLSSGFVNPYATGYSIDLIATWLVLIVWVVYEYKAHRIKHGWVCILLGLVPGVVVGFTSYLLLRQNQLSKAGDAAS